uniref:Ig-like domain-containing protein n=1 Tax=Cyprinus carpio TaxID=7962 RepID=A0A8C1VMM2_CYPCA
MTSTCVIPSKDISLGSSIDQPADMMKHQGNTLMCKYDDSGKTNMLWYQQKNTAMALIVLSYGADSEPTYEDGFKERFKLERKNTLNGVLKIPDLSLSDSAVYFCAVSMHSVVVFINCLTKTQATRHTGNTHKKI